MKIKCRFFLQRVRIISGITIRLETAQVSELKRQRCPICSVFCSDIDDFHCSLLKFGRYNCVLLTNNKTLYSFFLFGLIADNFKHFEEVVREIVFKLLIESGLAQSQFEKILESMETFNYSKTSNRNVIASMNDMKKQIESYLEMGDDIYATNKKLNKTLYKTIGYNYPVELFREMLKREIIS